MRIYLHIYIFLSGPVHMYGTTPKKKKQKLSFVNFHWYLLQCFETIFSCALILGPLRGGTNKHMNIYVYTYIQTITVHKLKN